MNNISTQLVDAFNEILKEEGSILRLTPDKSVVRIGLIQEKYLNMEHQVINPTNEFYKDLESFFLNVGLKLEYNNTASCFWANEIR